MSPGFFSASACRGQAGKTAATATVNVSPAVLVHSLGCGLQIKGYGHKKGGIGGGGGKCKNIAESVQITVSYGGSLCSSARFPAARFSRPPRPSRALLCARGPTPIPFRPPPSLPLSSLTAGAAGPDTGLALKKMYLDSGRSDTKTFCISANTMGEACARFAGNESNE